MFLTHLMCTSCGRRHEWSRLQNVCTACRKPLFAQYDLTSVKRVLTHNSLTSREKSLWRIENFCLASGVEPISLAKWNAAVASTRFAKKLGCRIFGLKMNRKPNAKFQTRGMSVAVSMAKYLGATKLAAPSAGNAGGASRLTPRGLSGSARFHAARYSARQHHRMSRARSTLDTHRWPHHRCGRNARKK